METPLYNLAVVAIGRNEGDRLRTCLRSILQNFDAAQVIYVDSDSTDGSADLAITLGVQAIRLSNDQPFTAARARNAGFRAIADTTEFIQFIDGDCELVPTWLPTALKTFEARPDLAVVCGRRRERFPGASAYNQLCDIEWNTPIGNSDACGGDALIRTGALRQIAGYDELLVAGEDPEMCARLRVAGWKIERIDADMTIHDAAMTRFGQWWRRMVRAGHAYAEVSAKHSGIWVKETRSNWLWGALLPLIAIALAWPTRGISLAVAAIGYFTLWAKILREKAAGGAGVSIANRKSQIADSSHLYARYTTLAKFPLACGQALYWFNRLRGRRARIIEYKSSSAPLTGGARA